MDLDDTWAYGYIDETEKLTQGQGHKVKGQGHLTIYV